MPALSVSCATSNSKLVLESEVDRKTTSEKQLEKNSQLASPGL